MAVLAAGLLPPLVLPDRLERLEGGNATAAREALELAWIGCADHPIERALTRARRVADVRRVAGGEHEAAAVHPALAGYEVELQTHTLFGLPRRSILVREDEVRC